MIRVMVSLVFIAAVLAGCAPAPDGINQRAHGAGGGGLRDAWASVACGVQTAARNPEGKREFVCGDRRACSTHGCLLHLCGPESCVVRATAPRKTGQEASLT